MNIAIKKSKLRSSAKGGPLPLKGLRNSQITSEKVYVKFNKLHEIDNNKSDQKSNENLKMSNFLSVNQNKNLQKHLFSKQASVKNIEKIKTEKGYISEKINFKEKTKFLPLDVKIKNLETVSEFKIINNKLSNSQNDKKKIKSNRDNLAVFNKFSKIKKINMNSSEVEIENKLVVKASLTSTLKKSNHINNLDFIENINLKTNEKLPKLSKSKKEVNLEINSKNTNLIVKDIQNEIKNKPMKKKTRLYESKHFENDLESEKEKNVNEINDTKTHDKDLMTFTNKKNTEKNLKSNKNIKQSREFKNVYDSIGKIKEFVKKTSIIELKPVNKSHNLKYLNPNKTKNNLYQSEQGKIFNNIIIE